jgi:hypothetical protein
MAFTLEGPNNLSQDIQFPDTNNKGRFTTPTVIKKLKEWIGTVK